MNRAEEIKRLYTQTLFMAFAVLFVVFLVVINELESIFPGLRRMYLGGAVFGPSFILAHICAYRRCRRAGLIDEPVKTIEVIPRTVVNVVPERFGVWIRDRLTILLLLLGLVFYGSFAVYGWLELRKSGFDAVHHLASAFDVIVFAILAVFIVRSLLFPVAKLDDEGISGRHRGHFWRRVRWPDIDSCEIVTVSGENERVYRDRLFLKTRKERFY